MDVEVDGEGEDVVSEGSRGLSRGETGGGGGGGRERNQGKESMIVGCCMRLRERASICGEGVVGRVGLEVFEAGGLMSRDGGG